MSLSFAAFDTLSRQLLEKRADPTHCPGLLRVFLRFDGAEMTGPISWRASFSKPVAYPNTQSAEPEIEREIRSIVQLRRC